MTNNRELKGVEKMKVWFVGFDEIMVEDVDNEEEAIKKARNIIFNRDTAVTYCKGFDDETNEPIN